MGKKRTPQEQLDLVRRRYAGLAGSKKVIGVDMTPEMIARARVAAANADCSNIDFRLGELSHLPVADGTVDVILSNCVINLTPDKRQVFREAYRVLKPGGRLAISDVVRIADIRIVVNDRSDAFIKDWEPGSGSEQYVRAALIEARR